MKLTKLTGSCRLMLSVLLAVFFMAVTVDDIQARNLTMTVHGASNAIDDLQLNSDINYFQAGDFLTLSVTNTSRVEGDVYVSLIWGNPAGAATVDLDPADPAVLPEDRPASYDVLWFEFVQGPFPYITFTDPDQTSGQNKIVLGSLEPRETIYLWSYYTFGNVEYPVTFVAYLWDPAAAALIGMDSKTVFLNPPAFTLTP